MGLRMIPRLLSSHLLSIAGIAVLYAIVFGILLPVVLQDWPYSPYYNATQSYVDIVRRIVWVRLLLLKRCIILYH